MVRRAAIKHLKGNAISLTSANPVFAVQIPRRMALPVQMTVTNARTISAMGLELAPIRTKRIIRRVTTANSVQ